MSWRQTSGCDPKGSRDPSQDKACSEVIPDDLSGFCECKGGQRKMEKGCSKGRYDTCDSACSHVLEDSAVANSDSIKCFGPTRCGSNNFCVGFEYDRIFCYGSENGCLWNSMDCLQDSDCSKYTTQSLKYSNLEPKICNFDYLKGWERDACTCEKGI